MPVMPHSGPRNIIQSSREEYFSTNIHHFDAKYAKKAKSYYSKNYDQNIMKSFRKAPAKPQECPRTIVLSSGEKYLSTKSP